jgi:hypothetical protein
MPKISANQRFYSEAKGVRNRIDYDIYYIPAKDYKPACFFAAPIGDSKKYLPENHPDIEQRYLTGGKALRGFEETTEEKAIDAMEAYFKKYFEAGASSEKVIVIRKKERQTYSFDIPEPNIKKVRFEFWVFDKVTAGGQTQYIKDESYKFQHRAHSNSLGKTAGEKELENFTILSYTPELAATCEEICKKLDKIQETIYKSFSSQAKALETLTGNKFLTFK